MPTNDPFTPTTGDPLYVAEAIYYDENYAKQRDIITQAVVAGGLISLGSGLPAFYIIGSKVIDWYRNKYQGTPIPSGVYTGKATSIELERYLLRPNQHGYGSLEEYETRIEAEETYAEEGDRDYQDYLYYGKWLYPKKLKFKFFHEKGKLGLSNREFRDEDKKKKHDNDNNDQNRDNNDAGEGGNGGAPFAGGGPSTIPFPPAPPPVPLEEEEEEIIADIIENIEDEPNDRINDKKPPLDQLFKDWWRRATDQMTSSMNQASSRVGQYVARSTRTVGTRTTTNPLFQS